MISIFEITDIIGTAAFAISGFLVGTREKLDLFGIFIVSLLTALGGGLVRDAIVSRPPYSLTHVMPITIVVLVIILCIILRVYRKNGFDQSNLFVIADAIGLVSFSITGALIGIDAGLSGYGIIIVALLTAIGGGLIRDMLINQFPLILKKDLYGSIALFVGFSVYALNCFNAVNSVNLAILFIIALFFRLYAYFKKINLPSL